MKKLECDLCSIGSFQSTRIIVLFLKGFVLEMIMFHGDASSNITTATMTNPDQSFFKGVNKCVTVKISLMSLKNLLSLEDWPS